MKEMLEDYEHQTFQIKQTRQEFNNYKLDIEKKFNSCSRRTF